MGILVYVMSIDHDPNNHITLGEFSSNLNLSFPGVTLTTKFHFAHGKFLQVLKYYRNII